MIDRGTDCHGKAGFDNIKLAKLAAARRKNRDVYRCRVCGKYHVGGNARNFRKAKQWKEGHR